MSTLARPYRALTIGLVVLVALMAFEAIAVTAAMPAIVTALDGLTVYGMAFGGTMAAGIVGTTVGGGWADARGPAAPLWAGTAGFVAGLLLSGLATGMELLIAGRIVMGFGAGLATVAMYVIVGRAYPEELHPRVFAAFAGAWLVPSLVGPAVAGVLVELAGWRWVFLGVALLTAPAALAVAPSMRSLADHRGDGARHGGRVLWAVGAAVGAVGLHFAGERHDPLLIPLFLAGLVATAPRTLPSGTFALKRGIPSLIVTRGLLGAAFAQAEVFIPLMLTRERGYSTAAAGVSLTIGAVGWVAGSWLQSRAPRITPERKIGLGVVLVATGVTAAAVSVLPEAPIAVLLTGWVAGGFGMGVAYPTLSAQVLALSAPSEQGANSSALQLGDQLFSTTVLALGGTLFAAWVASSASAAFLSSFVIAEALALLALVAVPRTVLPLRVRSGGTSVERSATGGAGATVEA
ncbi:MFS transporter [Actinocorallia longicatena]|uniref:MFS transporter n=1 Tax=Actinocorallia longicatena TaxID=111803 RepID=A0ABP6Q7E2_9ACTN